jgi:P63C domain
LNEKELEMAKYAEMIIRSVAKVGIIALIDEATGYQKQKDEYQKTLAIYIAEEMRPWVKTFKDEYYEQLYKLLDWDWHKFIAGTKNHPQVL